MINRILMVFIIVSQVFLYIQVSLYTDNCYRMKQSIELLAKAVIYLKENR